MEEKYFNKMNEDYQDWLINRENSMGKEKTADEMFEELGYVKLSEDFYENGDINIMFNADETIIKEEYHSCINAYVSKPINMQELQAINKKCKELGWI